MAKKNSTEVALKNLTPNAVDVRIDGKDVRVASNREENTILNMIMASQMRTLIQEHVKKYNESESTLTPKELRDLAAAARDVAVFSAEVYGMGEPIGGKAKEEEKQAEDVISFEDEPETPSTPSNGPDEKSSG